MTERKITYPYAKRRIRTGGETREEDFVLRFKTLYAAGRMPATETGEPVLKLSRDAGGYSQPGKVRAIILRDARNTQPARKIWIASFPVLSQGDWYTLEMNGADPVRFRVEIPNPDGSPRPRAVDIQSPTNNEDITLQAESFFAFGTLEAPLEYASMTNNTTSTGYSPTYLYHDYPTDVNWSALFPPLTSGSYTLAVKEEGSDAKNVTGLYVA